MKVMDNKGNRRFERTDFRVRGLLTCGDDECPINVINISLKGILISPDRETDPEIGKTYPLKISLPHSDIGIFTEARLMHKKDGQYGFRFDTIEADSMIHLRRLLELNSSSGDEIQNELSFLGD